MLSIKKMVVFVKRNSQALGKPWTKADITDLYMQPTGTDDKTLCVAYNINDPLSLAVYNCMRAVNYLYTNKSITNLDEYTFDWICADFSTCLKHINKLIEIEEEKEEESGGEDKTTEKETTTISPARIMKIIKIVGTALMNDYTSFIRSSLLTMMFRNLLESYDTTNNLPDLTPSRLEQAKVIESVDEFQSLWNELDSTLLHRRGFMTLDEFIVCLVPQFTFVDSSCGSMGDEKVFDTLINRIHALLFTSVTGEIKVGGRMCYSYYDVCNKLVSSELFTLICHELKNRRKHAPRRLTKINVNPSSFLFDENRMSFVNAFICSGDINWICDLVQEHLTKKFASLRLVHRDIVSRLVIFVLPMVLTAVRYDTTTHNSNAIMANVIYTQIITFIMGQKLLAANFDGAQQATVLSNYKNVHNLVVTLLKELHLIVPPTMLRVDTLDFIGDPIIYNSLCVRVQTVDAIRKLIDVDLMNANDLTRKFSTLLV